jgi:hypothetical protein
MFAPILRSMAYDELEAEVRDPRRLLLETSAHRGKRIDIAYAPFDQVNLHAKIVIVGLTPGRQQMRNALLEAHRQLLSGKSVDEALAAAKVFASFSGPMRSNLVGMLDDIGVSDRLGLSTAASLWGQDNHLVQFTSVLRYPVFIDGANYSGNPDILVTKALVNQVRTYFAAEMRVLSGAIFVPLGPRVTAALEMLADQCGIDQSQVLSGLPHPSGANSERIAYFLGRKTRDALSGKTNPYMIDEARRLLVGKMQRLAGGTNRG